jgi:signal transduction histidine kinase
LHKHNEKSSGKLTSIADHVSKESSRLFVLCTIVQLFSVSVLLSYLSYKEAENRAGVLARGSASSLGLLMSAGDLFQIKNLLKSFTTHETVSVHLIDEYGKVLSSASQDKTELPPFKGRFQIKDWQIFLWVKHPIVFNSIHYGDLVFLNKIQVQRWLIISIILLVFNTIFFLWQNSALKKLSLRIGKAVNEVVKIFDSDPNVSLDNNHRERTTFYEIEQLADNVLDAMDRIKMAYSLEKEAAIGRITAHLSHDMRAPLSTIERLMIAPDYEVSRMKIAVSDSLNRLYSMIEALRHTESETLIHRVESKLDFDFGKESLIHKALSKGIELEINKENFDVVLIDAPKLERAWINVASNAIEAAKTFVRVEASTRSDSLIIRVIDDGSGIPDEFLPKLFQRGATHGKTDGTGLGLAYVRQIMRGHGGDVTYRRENDLTIFECRLPNAVLQERDQLVKKTACSEIELQQKCTKRVAICLEPISLSLSVLSRINSYESNDFAFSKEREGAHIVVSNIDEIMFAVLEGEEQEFIHVSQLWGDENVIVDRLVRKFNLS